MTTRSKGTPAQTALDKVAHYRKELAAATKAKAHATAKFHEWITKARDLDCTSAEIATVAGVSRERVVQIAPVAKARAPHAQAGKKRAVVSRANGDAVPSLADHGLGEGSALSGVVTSRKRRPYGRATVFYRDGLGVTEQGRSLWLGWPDHDNTVDGILTTIMAGMPDVSEVRVYLTGETPAVPQGEATQAEAVREWALTFTPAGGWRSSSHYLNDPALPVLRFVNDTNGQKVTIMRAASWWGETDANQETCAEAWRGLAWALENERAFAGAGIADTPATTGRALWQRTIPEGKSYPVLSRELRELIAATSGQGRIELLPPAADKVPSFTYLDGRFMYGSLCWGLPVGEPVFWTQAQVDRMDSREWTKAIRGRGRWRITMTVPEDWEHVGLFMAPAAGGGWEYPCEPGRTFTTWADGHELWLATTRGWDPVVHEGFTMAEGKPLDLWVKKLLDIWRAADAHKDNSAAQLAARAVRSIVITAIGAFATRAHPVTRTAPLDQAPEDLPAGTEVRRVGDSLVWQEVQPLSGWAEELSHPEWSATIWARARARLLDGKGVNNVQVGALHVPREQIVAFSTDALYLTSDPGWADDQGAGRFRVKGRLDKPHPWPLSASELYALRDKAERSGS